MREVVSSYYFGATGKINAFTVAFQLPNLVRALVADAALSSAFVPVFSELLEKGDASAPGASRRRLFWLMLLGLSALTAIFILVAPWIIGIFGNPGHDKALAVGLSRVLFPIVTLLGVSGIVVGILNSYDHFTVPALSPVFWNLAIIAGLAIGVPQAHTMNTKLYVYAFSILIATVIQVFLPMPWLRGRDGRLQLVLDWRDPAVKRVFVLMIPVTLGLGLINVNAVIDTFFASRLIDADLAPTAIQKAFLVYMLPQGMFSVAIATVLFPSLSRFATRGDMDGFRATVSTGLRQIAFLLIPAAVVSAVLAEPIVRILFQRGAFHALPDAGRRALARGIQRRPRLQRRDADAEPRVLQPPVELDPDGGRARQPLPERGSRLCVLPVRRLGDSARDRRLQRRGHVGAARPAAPAAGAHRRRADRADSRTRRLASAVRRRASRGSSGSRSTPRSAARSARRSCRSGSRSPRRSVTYLVAAALLRVRELDTLLSLGRGSGARDRVPAVRGERSATSAPWLEREHVRLWWREPIEHELAHDRAGRWIIARRRRPVGMIQSYDEAGRPAHRRGGAIGRASARRFSSQFARGVVFARSEITALVATVEEGNLRSWRAFEKAGFRYVRDVQEEVRPHRLMRLDRS